MALGEPAGQGRRGERRERKGEAGSGAAGPGVRFSKRVFTPFPGLVWRFACRFQHLLTEIFLLVHFQQDRPPTKGDRNLGPAPCCPQLTYHSWVQFFFLMPILIPISYGAGQVRRKCNLNLATGGPTQVARNCRVIFSKTPRGKIDGALLRIPVSKYAGRQKMPPPNTKTRAGTKLPRAIKFGPLAWKWPG